MHNVWYILHNTEHFVGDILGFIPEIIDLSSDRPFVEMINENYSHGGGWSPFGEGEWKLDAKDAILVYPAKTELEPEERYLPLALGFLKTGGLVLIYEDAWVCWVPDLAHLDKFQVARMD
jgi:hypothetical protein